MTCNFFCLVFFGVGVELVDWGASTADSSTSVRIGGLGNSAGLDIYPASAYSLGYLLRNRSRKSIARLLDRRKSESSTMSFHADPCLLKAERRSSSSAFVKGRRSRRAALGNGPSMPMRARSSEFFRCERSARDFEAESDDTSCCGSLWESLRLLSETRSPY